MLFVADDFAARLIMSRQKRGVQYIQQDEPAFLKRMKQQAGYKEGPTIDSKRQQMPEQNSDSDTDGDDEKPQVDPNKQW